MIKTLKIIYILHIHEFNSVQVHPFCGSIAVLACVWYHIISNLQMLLLLQSLTWGMIYLTAEESNDKITCGDRSLAKRFHFWWHPLPIGISKSCPDRADTCTFLSDSNKPEIKLPNSALEFKLSIRVSLMAVVAGHCSTRDLSFAHELFPQVRHIKSLTLI